MAAFHQPASPVIVAVAVIEFNVELLERKSSLKPVTCQPLKLLSAYASVEMDVLLSNAAWVGAVGVPVNAGLRSFARADKRVPESWTFPDPSAVSTSPEGAVPREERAEAMIVPAPEMAVMTLLAASLKDVPRTRMAALTDPDISAAVPLPMSSTPAESREIPVSVENFSTWPAGKSIVPAAVAVAADPAVIPLLLYWMSPLEPAAVVVEPVLKFPFASWT